MCAKTWATAVKTSTILRDKCNLQLFSAIGPLEFVAMYILCPPPKTTKSSQHVATITGIYSKWHELCLLLEVQWPPQRMKSLMYGDFRTVCCHICSPTILHRLSANSLASCSLIGVQNTWQPLPATHSLRDRWKAKIRRSNPLTSSRRHPSTRLGSLCAILDLRAEHVSVPVHQHHTLHSLYSRGTHLKPATFNNQSAVSADTYHATDPHALQTQLLALIQTPQTRVNNRIGSSQEWYERDCNTKPCITSTLNHCQIVYINETVHNRFSLSKYANHCLKQYLQNSFDRPRNASVRSWALCHCPPTHSSREKPSNVPCCK